MRLLLDTHIYLWVLKNDPKLTANARHLIEIADGVFISSASIWEMAIKANLGKLEADIDAMVEQITLCGFKELPIHAYHTTWLKKLAPHHRDPFDRMLIAQAMAEPLQLLTADAQLTPYSELVVLAK